MKHLLSLTVFFLLLSSTTVISQSSKKNKMSKADKAFMMQNYYEAEKLYKADYSKEKNRAKKAELIFLQAECARNIGTPIYLKKAMAMYKRSIKAKYPHAEVYLRYGQVLQKQQKFNDAIVQYKKYKEFKPNDDRPDQGIESCMFALEALENPSRYEITPFQHNTNQEEYSPCYASKDYDELFFTSSRDGSLGKSDGFSGNSYTDIYWSKYDKKKKRWSKPSPFEEPMNTANHEAAPALNKRGNELYFTRCIENSKIKPIPTCEIYYSKKKGKNWISPVLLPLPYDSVSSFAHPSLSSDGKVLYFSSDMKGGYGGKDIWFIKKLKRDEWSEPINLGDEINTSGNELFPFIHADGSLYFSSDGHLGMGGLDIFKAEFDSENNLRSVNNMNSPINSSNDDFGIIFEDEEERGYLSSNRIGSKGDDIYRFNLPKLNLTISGIITDQKTKQIIPGATIDIIGSDGSTSQTVTDNSGRYLFDKDFIQENVSYSFSVSSEGYLSTNFTQSTIGVKESVNMVQDIVLEATQKEIVLPKIEYDYNSAELRKESKEALDALVSVLAENPNVVIQLRSHTDNRAGNDFNMELSQRRAQICVDYMVDKGIMPKRLIAKGMGENEPYVMDVKDGKLRPGAILNESFFENLKRKKDIEKAHQYNRRTDFKVVLDKFYDAEADRVLPKKK
ncbi:OmpA family protein [Flavobacteriales bacterium]|nr:OmpA family protein [Flavobacteriales bacterium]